MRIKKKYSTGTARVFISRKKAMKKLQISLNDFRRLSILKGIYPREPKHVKKANKGGTQNRIFYHLRDINFLAQEPLLQKFRQYKIFLRKIDHARARREESKVKTLLQSKPIFTYDHLVKERYPTFSSALRDLDDALCLSFAFVALPMSRAAHPRVINRCKKLVTEFMHYVIEAKALRKVFISIKGIYYQAEVMGERITWICGHERAIGRSSELDFTTMAHFIEFYTCMLSFVNYRLFKSIGLFYPPQLQQQQQFAQENEYNFGANNELDERIYSLAFSIKKTEKMDSSEEPPIPIDFSAEDIAMEMEGGDLIEKMRQIEALKTLFSKCKFFLNREVPKESLAFIIRSSGGFVCWEGCSPNGIDETSELITHQIVDREMQKMDMNRIYVQPQWVFDCFNVSRLLPTQKYAPGAVLPPHLSPFVDENNREEFMTEERICQINDEEEKILDRMAGSSQQNGSNKKKKKQMNNNNEQKGMRVQKAKVYRESHQKKLNEEGHNLKLKEMMIKKKHKRVYEKIKRGIKKKARNVNQLRQKKAKLEMMEEGG